MLREKNQDFQAFYKLLKGFIVVLYFKSLLQKTGRTVCKKGLGALFPITHLGLVDQGTKASYFFLSAPPHFELDLMTTWTADQHASHQALGLPIKTLVMAKYSSIPLSESIFSKLILFYNRI